jgi:trimeric autotransporter adhesin
MSPKQKLRLACTLAMLVASALTISCTGFFVNPTLTAVSVGPSGLNLTVNQTFQMTATGTNSDGTQKTLTSGVVWSSDAASIVSVGQNSGLVTGLQIGSANITASSGGCSSCSGSTSVTVVLNNVTSITVMPSSQTASAGGTAAVFTATAQPGSVDITQNATWKVFDSTNTDQTANFAISLTSLGESFLPNSGVLPGAYSVVASYSSTTITGKATLNVN